MADSSKESIFYHKHTTIPKSLLILLRYLAMWRSCQIQYVCTREDICGPSKWKEMRSWHYNIAKQHKHKENENIFQNFSDDTQHKQKQIITEIFQSAWYLASSMKIWMSLTNKILRKQQNINIFREIVCRVEVWWFNPMEGYNWEKYESNMWPALAFHCNIKSHIYETAWKDN